MTAERTREAFFQAWAGVVARSWTDPALRRQMLDDPAAVLASVGYPVPQEVAVRAVEGRVESAPQDRGEVVVYLPVPLRPDDGSGREPVEVARGLLGADSGIHIQNVDEWYPDRA